MSSFWWHLPPLTGRGTRVAQEHQSTSQCSLAPHPWALIDVLSIRTVISSQYHHHARSGDGLELRTGDRGSCRLHPRLACFSKSIHRALYLLPSYWPMLEYGIMCWPRAAGPRYPKPWPTRQAVMFQADPPGRNVGDLASTRSPRFALFSALISHGDRRTQSILPQEQNRIVPLESPHSSFQMRSLTGLLP